MVTQREVAKRAGISLKTVSRAINGDPLVNAETRARISQVIAEMGYEPDQAARMMRTQKSNIIGFLADQVATTSSSIELIRGAQDAAWENGKQMMLFNIERNTGSEILAEAQLQAFRAEAVIYATTFHQEVAVLPSKIPRVLLNCFDAAGHYPAVVPDDFQLAHAITTHLLRRGYRKPHFLNLPQGIVAASLRREGYLRAGREFGLDLFDTVVTAVEDVNGSTRFLSDDILPNLMSDAKRRPDILLCGQDTLATDVYFSLASNGLQVPKDVAVASFDNLEPIVSLVRPGLTTMELPYYAMGRQAMICALEGVSKPVRHRLPGRLIERQSL